MSSPDEDVLDAIKRYTGATKATIKPSPPAGLLARLKHLFGLHTMIDSYEYTIDTAELTYVGLRCVLCDAEP